MIAEHSQTAIKGKLVYLRLPTKEEANAFFDSLHVNNKSLDDKIITFNFLTEQDAKDFHIELINKFGDRTDQKVNAILKGK